jgi:hypothetical protein
MPFAYAGPSGSFEGAPTHADVLASPPPGRSPRTFPSPLPSPLTFHGRRKRHLAARIHVVEDRRALALIVPHGHCSVPQTSPTLLLYVVAAVAGPGGTNSNRTKRTSVHPSIRRPQARAALKLAARSRPPAAVLAPQRSHIDVTSHATRRPRPGAAGPAETAPDSALSPLCGTRERHPPAYRGESIGGRQARGRQGGRPGGARGPGLGGVKGRQGWGATGWGVGAGVHHTYFTYLQ